VIGTMKAGDIGDGKESTALMPPGDHEFWLFEFPEVWYCSIVGFLKPVRRSNN
jgi:hypothetical protein